MSKGGKKQAKIPFDPSPQKTPVASARIDGSTFSWRFSQGDRSGPWAWTAIATDALHREIIDRLANHETMSFDEIRKAGSHWIDLYELNKQNKEVGKRLEAIRQDDVDGLFSFRINKAGRVFCIRRSQVMSVLWWDPRHEVWPMNITGN